MKKSLHFLASVAIYSLIKILSWTYRFTFVGLENFEKQNVVACIWHQNILAACCSHTKKPFITMVSQSKDGELIARCFRWLGCHIARGSSHRGGKAAKEQIVEMARNHMLPVVLTVDGPTGPIYKAKPGAIKIATETNRKVVPADFIIKSYWSIKSWDRFKIPKPFTKITIQYQAALDFESIDQGIEQLNLKLLK